MTIGNRQESRDFRVYDGVLILKGGFLWNGCLFLSPWPQPSAYLNSWSITPANAMMTEHVYFLQDYEAVSSGAIEARPFYVSDDLVAVLVTMQPGARVPVHVHEHHDEIFDVIKGTGAFFLGDETIEFSPGMTIVAPAGTRHGLLAGDERWVLRETVHRHVYARQAIKRALKKRFGGK